MAQQVQEVSLFPACTFDILIGICGAISIKGIVYFKGKNAKKYRKGVEYGSARWGTSEDIKPFIDPKFSKQHSINTNRKNYDGQKQNTQI